MLFRCRSAKLVAAEAAADLFYDDYCRIGRHTIDIHADATCLTMPPPLRRGRDLLASFFARAGSRARLARKDTGMLPPLHDMPRRALQVTR